MEKIPLTKPYIPEGTLERVKQVLDSGHLTEGSLTTEFEDSVKEYVGCEYALAVCNATCGLEAALRMTSLTRGHQVIVPAYTHPASIHSIYNSGLRPIMVDVDRDTMLMDYEQVEKAIDDNTEGILAVSLFGNPLDYDALNSIKKKHNLWIIEDAACSLGSEFRGAKVGNLADVTVFSFHPRKIITTGEGGMITTNSREIYERLRQYIHFGGSEVFAGNNYKMSNINAAIGLEQMEVIDWIITKKRVLANLYISAFSEIVGIEISKITDYGLHSWQSFCVILDDRDWIKVKLAEKRIETQVGSHCLPSDLPYTNYLIEHVLSLPVYHEMKLEDQDRVMRELKCAVSST